MKMIVTKHKTIGSTSTYREIIEHKLWFAWIKGEEETTEVCGGGSEHKAVFKLIEKHGRRLKIELVRKSS